MNNYIKFEALCTFDNLPQLILTFSFDEPIDLLTERIVLTKALSALTKQELKMLIKIDIAQEGRSIGKVVGFTSDSDKSIHESTGKCFYFRGTGNELWMKLKDDFITGKYGASPNKNIICCWF